MSQKHLALRVRHHRPLAVRLAPRSPSRAAAPRERQLLRFRAPRPRPARFRSVVLRDPHASLRSEDRPHPRRWQHFSKKIESAQITDAPTSARADVHSARRIHKPPARHRRREAVQPSRLRASRSVTSVRSAGIRRLGPPFTDRRESSGLRSSWRRFAAREASNSRASSRNCTSSTRNGACARRGRTLRRRRTGRFLRSFERRTRLLRSTRSRARFALACDVSTLTGFAGSSCARSVGSAPSARAPCRTARMLIRATAPTARA
jgi:hypothetical protein